MSAMVSICVPPTVAGPRAAAGPAPSVAAARARYAGIEWVRLLACLGVVAFHAGVQPVWLVKFSMFPFAIFTVALAAGSARGRRWPEYARHRVRSRGIPWLAWSVVYAGLSVAWAVRHGDSPLGWVRPWMAFAGPSLHLWFLPFAIVASLLAGWWAIRTTPQSPRAWVGWLLVGAASLVALNVVSEHHGWPTPVGQWLGALPAIPLGVAFASIPAGDRAGTLPLMFAAAMAVAIGWWGLAAGHEAVAISYMIAVPVCAVAWRLPGRAGPATLAWSSLSFGVYLVHPLVDVLFHMVSRTESAWLTALWVSVLSLGATWCIRRSPVSWVFLGVGRGGAPRAARAAGPMP